jgi:hypothetical protein
VDNNLKVQEFDDFFVQNYSYLLGFAKSIDVRNDYESLLHDCYLKLRLRIYLSGYSGTTYLNFTRVTIMNTYKTNYRDAKYTVDYTNENFVNEVENCLQEEETYRQQKCQHDYEMVFLNTMAYEYVNKYFTPKENAIFRTYYLLKHKKINYRQLAIMTKYSQQSVSNCIKRIKKSLKANLMCYINTGLNIMELEEKIKKVEDVLAKPLNKNLGLYKQTYIDVYGKPFKSSCSCQITRIKTDLQVWVQKNKPLLNNN